MVFTGHPSTDECVSNSKSHHISNSFKNAPFLFNKKPSPVLFNFAGEGFLIMLFV